MVMAETASSWGGLFSMPVVLSPSANDIKPELAELLSIYLSHHVDWLSAVIDTFHQPAIFDLHPQWEFTGLDTVIPAKRDGAGKRVVLKIDRVVGQVRAGLTPFGFDPLVLSKT